MVDNRDHPVTAYKVVSFDENVVKANKWIFIIPKNSPSRDKYRVVNLENMLTNTYGLTHQNYDLTPNGAEKPQD